MEPVETEQQVVEQVADQVAEDNRREAANAAEMLAAVPTAPKSFVFGGYAEAFYQWNFNRPGNGITNFRGFDNRHNSFTLANAALDAQWDAENVVGRVTLQVGHTPSTYYLAEPVLPGASGANLSGPELWKYLQQAYVGYRIEKAAGLTVTAGLFLSPIGPEGMAVRDNWNWSRSNLFFGLPFYHTGVRLAQPLGDRWTLTLAGSNGWNSVTDNNAEKSVSLQAAYAVPEKLALSLLYFGGVERPTGAPEGRPWRSLFDAHLTWNVSPAVSVLVHGNGGFEQTKFGTAAWGAGAIYGRFKVAPIVYLAVRGDLFYEKVAESDEGQSSPIFWPAPWVSSGTGTVELRPHDRVVVRAEYRHDQAGGEMFFSEDVVGDGLAAPYVADRRFQDTVTVGLTTWF